MMEYEILSWQFTLFKQILHSIRSMFASKAGIFDQGTTLYFAVFWVPSLGWEGWTKAPLCRNC